MKKVFFTLLFFWGVSLAYADIIDDMIDNITDMGCYASYVKAFETDEKVFFTYEDLQKSVAASKKFVAEEYLKATQKYIDAKSQNCDENDSSVAKPNILTGENVEPLINPQKNILRKYQFLWQLI